MAQFDNSYEPPGVYTTTNFIANTPNLVDSARVAVIIGEGNEYFTRTGVELHRGSSSSADDGVVGENISNQVGGSNRTYQLTYFPVVTGGGTGTTTNDPTLITVTADGLPVVVTSLNGKLGTFQTQNIIPTGQTVLVSYFFKKTDTLITKENLTPQIPSFASLTISGELQISLSNPGYLGNNVSITLTDSGFGNGVSDAVAVTGNGTDAISINLRQQNNLFRSYLDLATIIQAGIQTLDGGFLTATLIGASAQDYASVLATSNLTGGAGQSTNTVFKTAFTPIVDGTNGGIVTTDPTKVTVLLNGVATTVTALDGVNGLVTVLNGVDFGSTLEITYYTNKYTDTTDALPDQNVATITSVGYGVGRSDFIQGVDYFLSGNGVAWGSAASTATGVSTPGYTAFDSTIISTTLVDEAMYLVPVSGVVSGRNSVFTLADTPVDGTGLGVPTDNVANIQVFVGPDPVTAFNAGPVKVARLSGASATVTLYNPPPLSSNVYASYYRSLINDHEYTLAVQTQNGTGSGTYTITDELLRVIPSVKLGATSVANANFSLVGIVYPNNYSDLATDPGAPAETVTLTFQSDSLSTIIVPAIQAILEVADTSAIPRIQFTSVTPGTIGNTLHLTMVAGGTGAADASAVTVSGAGITIETVKADNVTVRTWQEIVTLFSTYPVTVPGVGAVICAGVAGADLSSQSDSLISTSFYNGANAILAPYADRFLVTSSRTLANSSADGLGITGGATTPAGLNTTLGTSGYVGQTYVDTHTGLRFTIVDPKSALSYGYTQLPSPSYNFAPGDTLTFVINPAAGFVTSAVPTVAIPGLQTEVLTTLGCNVGDTSVISTFKRSSKAPAIGDYYYVTYTVAKQASDYAIQLFTDEDSAYSVYGQPNNPNNRLAVAIDLFVQNGGSQFGVVQVPTQAGLGVGSDQAFIDAITSLASPFPGAGRRADVIIPLSTSPVVQQFLSSFLTRQATARNKGEATAFIGFDQFATPVTMAAQAAAIMNDRVVAVAPNYLQISLQSSVQAASVSYPFSGEFLAVAMAGLMLSPNNDVATSLTNQSVVGFGQSLISYDEPTKNFMAVNGITVCTDNSGSLNVRHYKTTDPSNDLTSEPYVITTADFINKNFRTLLKQFIGRKLTSDLPTTISSVLNGALKGWVNDLITSYTALSVTADPNDPTTLNISVLVVPMFSLLYLEVTLNVTLNP